MIYLPIDVLTIVFQFIPNEMKLLNSEFYSKQTKLVISHSDDNICKLIMNNSCKITNLEELIIYTPSRIIDYQLGKLFNFNKLKNLKKLTIYGYSELTDVGMEYIPDCIEELTLIFCVSITNKSLSRFTKLKKINIRSNCFFFF
jgi:hypothetical protein